MVKAIIFIIGIIIILCICIFGFWQCKDNQSVSDRIGSTIDSIDRDIQQSREVVTTIESGIKEAKRTIEQSTKILDSLSKYNELSIEQNKSAREILERLKEINIRIREQIQVSE